MWLPLTSRSVRRPGRGRARRAGRCSTHGPAAFTRMRAATVSTAPAAGAIVARQCRPPARPRRSGERVRITAPRSAASMRVEHDEPAVVDPAVGIGEAAREGRSCRGAPSGSVADRARAKPAGVRAPRQVVVEEEAGADHPGRPQARRRAAARRSAAGRYAARCASSTSRSRQCLAHQPELVVLEIAQAAMDELARRRRGARSRDRSFSTSSTFRPRPAASRAMPTPLMPPPMTRRSYAASSIGVRRRPLAPGRRGDARRARRIRRRPRPASHRPGDGSRAPPRGGCSRRRRRPGKRGTSARRSASRR